MAERQIKRNGRGQIVSYEIFGANDSNIDSDSYGKSVFNTNGDVGTKVSKFSESSYNANIDVRISDELLSEDKSITPNISLNSALVGSALFTP